MTIAPEENCPLLRVRDWVRVRLNVSIERQFDILLYDNDILLTEADIKQFNNERFFKPWKKFVLIATQLKKHVIT